MPCPYRSVFFDFDYTLGDATDCILAGFRYAFDQLGLPRPEDEEICRTIGMTLETAYTHLTADPDPEMRQRFQQLYIEKANPLQVEGTRLFPGCVELLDALKAEGVKIAIVSTKRRSVLEQVFAYQKLSDRVSVFVGGTDASRHKPAPDSIFLALTKTGSLSEKTLYVGDTVIDAEAAHRAGLDFAAVCNGTTPAAAFRGWDCAYIAEDLWDLKRWLGL